MIRTVDLVISGDSSTVCAPALDALRRGRRVLVVLACNAQAGRRVRRCLRTCTGADEGRVAVMTNAEVVCVDGVNGVEAVVIRRMRAGQLCAVNASAFLRSSQEDFRREQ
jgi:hypothetical protein